MELEEKQDMVSMDDDAKIESNQPTSDVCTKAADLEKSENHDVSNKDSKETNSESLVGGGSRIQVPDKEYSSESGNLYKDPTLLNAPLLAEQIPDAKKMEDSTMDVCASDGNIEMESAEPVSQVNTDNSGLTKNDSALHDIPGTEENVNTTSLNAPLLAEQIPDAKKTEDSTMDVCASDKNIEMESAEPVSQVNSGLTINDSALHNNPGTEENVNAHNICDTPSKNLPLDSPKASTPTPEMSSFNSITQNVCSDNISDDEISVIEIRKEQNDLQFSSLHRGTCVPYSDSDDTDSSSSSSDEDSSDESSESDDVMSVSGQAPKDPDGKKKTDSLKTVKAQGELDIDDLPPIEDLHISVRNDQASEIGKVLHAVDTLVVVESYKDQPPLDIDSVLFLDGGARPLGRIFDVMGPVTEPLYCVRFNSKEHIEKYNIQPGMLVYCAPRTEHSNFVFLKHLMMMKGSDASWKKDKEVPMAFLDFSDDEDEANLRRVALEGNRKATAKSQNPDEPKSKAPRTERSSNTRQPNTFENQFSSKDSSWKRGGVDGRHHQRNPWSWSGSRPNLARNANHSHSSDQNQYSTSGPLKPSSFNADFSASYHSQFPVQSLDRCPTRHSSNPNYSQESDQQPFPSRNPDVGQQRYPSSPQFGQLPPNNHQYNSAWPTWGQPQQLQGDGYSDNSAHFSPAHGVPPPQGSQDQRYHAFRSEIERLVSAYNRGVNTPMSVLPPSSDFRTPHGHPPSFAPPSHGTAPYGPPRGPPHYGPPPYGPPSQGPPPYGPPPYGPHQHGPAPPPHGPHPHGPPPPQTHGPHLRGPPPPPPPGSHPPGPPPSHGPLSHPNRNPTYENYY